jgi:hypothetical protein
MTVAPTKQKHKGERPMGPDVEFMNDKEIARIFKMSPSWVRGERFKRRHQLPHYLAIDPRLIGSRPRYVRAEVEALVQQAIQGDAA